MTKYTDVVSASKIASKGLNTLAMNNVFFANFKVLTSDL